MADANYDKNLFFQHVECDYFPCHKGISPEHFNCMLCYCPLYALGEACGGNYVYTAKGVKNCTPCTVPHEGDGGVRLVRARFSELAKLAAQKPELHQGGQEEESCKAAEAAVRKENA